MVKFTSKKNKGFTLSAQDIKDFTQTVIDFNALIGNDLLTTDPVMKAKLLKTYNTLSMEEITGEGELAESLEKGDKEGSLDGICDLLYTGLAYCVLEGGKCNLNRGEEWFDNEVWKGDSHSSFVEESIHDMIYSLEKNKVYAFQTELLILLGHLHHKMDIVAGFKRVTESNFSKAMLTSSIENVGQEIQTIIDKGRYTGVATREVGEYTVFTATGDLREGKTFASPKVIKSSQFKDVSELGGLLEFCK